MTDCKYCKDGFCVNADCPEVADFCQLDVLCDGTNYFENCEKIYCEYFESAEKALKECEKMREYKNYSKENRYEINR